MDGRRVARDGIELSLRSRYLVWRYIGDDQFRALGVKPFCDPPTDCAEALHGNTHSIEAGPAEPDFLRC
jgi:hypothetical protein